MDAIDYVNLKIPEKYLMEINSTVNMFSQIFYMNFQDSVQVVQQKEEDLANLVLEKIKMTQMYWMKIIMSKIYKTNSQKQIILHTFWINTIKLIF